MLIVKKFGGTSVANKERIFNVARRCIEDYKKGNDVVVVLSAMGKYTDELITMAKDINDKPPKREMDMLFTIGEQMSVALMSMAMDSLGVPAVSLNAFQVAMHTTSAHSSARLKKIDAARIRRELDNRRIVVVTGFQGIDKSGYEAGAIEGIKNRFQELLYITIPAMGPQLLFAAVMQITSSFTAGAFPSTDYAAHTIMTHAFDYGSVRYEMGYACAICFLLFIVMILVNNVIRKAMAGILDT